MAELHTGGVTAVLAADTQVDVGTGCPSHLRGHLHQLANPLLIQVGKGIGLIDLFVIIIVEELAG